MTDQGGGKIRPNRSKSSAKPYDRRRSFFGQVSDTVSQYLSPSWLFKSVSSIKKNKPAIDSGHGDSDSDRDRHGQNETGLAEGYYISSDTRASTSRTVSANHVTDPPLLTHSNVINRPEIYSTPKDTLKSTDLGQSIFKTDHSNKYRDSDNDDGEAGLPVVGVPIITVTTVDEPPVSLSTSTSHRQSSTTLSELRQSFSKKNKKIRLDTSRDKSTDRSTSLFSVTEQIDGDEIEPQRMATPSSRPSFNVSTFLTSLNKNHSRSLLTSRDNYMMSSFYPGKTCYGGASGQRGIRSGSSPYQAEPVRREVRPRVQAQTNMTINNVTSSTAKRIMETLEKMSTPLSDVKRMRKTDSIHSMDSPLSFTFDSYHNRPARSTQISTLTSAADLTAPPVQKLLVPQNVSVAKNRSSYPRQDTTEERSPLRNSSKMRNVQSRSHLSRRSHQHEIPEGEPDLPTEFTLPMNKLPRFDMNLTTPKTHPTRKEMENSPPVDVSQTFKFSSPIQQGLPSSPEKENKTKTDFKFCSPIQVKVTTSSPVVISSGQLTMSSQTLMSLARPKQSKPSLPETSLPAVGKPLPAVGKPSNQLKTGSVMDMLGCNKDKEIVKKTETETSSGGFGNKFKPAFGVWECDTCLVQNIASEKVCVACQTARPGGSSSSGGSGSSPVNSFSVGSATKPGSASTAGPSLADQFRPAEGSWECQTCLINNKSSHSECVACHSLKPDPTRSQSQQNTQSDVVKVVSWTATVSGSGPGSSWECDTCMIINKAAVDKCVACETPKPGLKTVPNNTTSAIEANDSVSFGEAGGLKIKSSSNVTGFSFGTTTSTPSQPITGEFTTISTPSQPITGGFQLNVPASGEGGFKFGTKTLCKDEVTAPSSAAGFKFGTDKPKETVETVKPLTGGFQFSAVSSVSGGENSLPTQLSTLTGSSKSKAESKVMGETRFATTDLSQSSTGDRVNIDKNSAKPTTETNSVQGAFSFGANQVQIKSGETRETPVSGQSQSESKAFAFGMPEKTSLLSSTVETSGSTTNFKIDENLNQFKTPAAISTLTQNAPLTISSVTQNAPGFVNQGHGSTVSNPHSSLFSFGQDQSTNKTTTFGQVSAGNPKTTAPSMFSSGSVGLSATQATVIPGSQTSGFSFGSVVNSTGSNEGGFAPAKPEVLPASSTGSALSKQEVLPARLPAPSTALFTFGAAATKTDQLKANSAVGGFAFGQGTSSISSGFGNPQKSAMSPGTPEFSFGTNSASMTTGDKSKAPASNDVFSFGGQPAAVNTATTSAPPSFSFGAPSTTSTATGVGVFNCGTENTVATSAPSRDIFSFGNTSTNTKTPAEAGQGQGQGQGFQTPIKSTGSQQHTSFKFASPAPDQTPGGFSFGAAAVAAPAPAAGSSSAVFSFGNTATATTAPAAFNFGTPAATPAAQFNFKPADNKSTPFGQNKTAFGAGTESAGSGSFNFGGTAPADSTAPAFGQFGQSIATESTPFSFTTESSNAMPQIPSTFSFGQPNQLANAGGFAFNAEISPAPPGFGNTALPSFGPATPSNPFSASTAPSSAPRRVIRKATRRTKK